MVDNYHGLRMEEVPMMPGSVARGRQLAERGLQRDGTGPNRHQTQQKDVLSTNFPIQAPPGTPKATRTKQPPAFEGSKGPLISRPTRVPQWPFSGGVSSPSSTDTADMYRPPAGRSLQAPQRPPRPSRIPSMVDQKRMQEPTPLFIAPVRTSNGVAENSESQHVFLDSEQTPSKVSSAGYIAELPLSSPNANNTSVRKGTVLGPPPSSRRGASSFYSTASYVSPIIEESTHSRSHGSYASSAAMPEAWRAGMPRRSHGYGDAFYEESMTDRSRDSTYDEYGDENGLMEEKNRGKGELLPASMGVVQARQQPIQADAPWGVADSAEPSTSSWNASAASKQTLETSLGTIQNAGSSSGKPVNPFASGYSQRFAELGEPTVSPVPFSGRNSVMKRPPKLDIDAVRAAESRGSLTSLPDLIRRATRLAAMIDKGKRPTSRLDDLSEYLDEKGFRNGNKDTTTTGGRPPSGLSDMLAAFPPPVQTPQNNGSGRGSWLRPSSWPLVPGSGRSAKRIKTGHSNGQRRCCGLPIWAFSLVAILLLCVLVAAIVVPLEIFVFKNIGNSEKPGLSIENCQTRLSCLNGGTNIVSQGSCSCICTGGFTGADCSTGGSVGCTTTNLISTEGSSEISNVTLGQAIPRLIADASSNFSLSLSGTAILAKINNAELSCIAQNSLVTFDGKSTRTLSRDSSPAILERHLVKHTMRRSGGSLTGHPTDHAIGLEPLSNPHSLNLEDHAKGIMGRQEDSSPFKVTEAAQDFCRVAILFILQEKGLDPAQDAQSHLQLFFTKVDQAQGSREQKVSEKEAANVTAGGKITLNLMELHIDIGNGTLLGENKAIV